MFFLPTPAMSVQVNNKRTFCAAALRVFAIFFCVVVSGIHFASAQGIGSSWGWEGYKYRDQRTR
jgi:hypothetical protein